MEELPVGATDAQIIEKANILGLEILDRGDGLFDMWSDQKYLGTGGSPAAFVSDINSRISINNYNLELKKEAEVEARKEALKKQAEEDEFRESIAHLTDKFSEAVLIDDFGKVCGICDTDIKGGGYIQRSGARTQSGAPINVTRLKVSRSRENFKKAEKKGAPFFSYYFFKNEFYYQ